MLGKKIFNKTKIFLKLSKIKKVLRLVALAVVGFAVGKLFGLGAIIGGTIIYRKAFTAKATLMQRLVATILGCLMVGISVTVLGNIGIAIVSAVGLMKAIVFAIIGITMSVGGFKFVRNRMAKKSSITIN